MSRLNFALSVLISPLALFSIQAQPGPPSLPGTATVSGVVTLKGEPARDATVQLLAHRPLSDDRPNLRNQYLARTDENGRFRITRAAAGKYWIFARAPGHISPGNDDMGIGGQSLSVTEGGKIENIALELKRGGAITGQITDSRGAPVVEEEVDLHRFDKDGKTRHFYPGYPHRYETDDRGVYRFYGLPEGRYLVSAGYENTRPRVFYPNVTGESEAKVIEVAGESEISGIDITFPDRKRPSIKRERTGEITVRLVTEDGAGLPDVKIDMQPAAEDGSILLGSGGVLDTTDEDGNFRFPKNGSKDEPSLYQIRVSHAGGYAPKRLVNKRVGDDVTIVMVKGGVITGRVTNAKGEPVVGADVVTAMARDAEGKPIHEGTAQFRISTDDRGVYRFHGLTPGTYVVFTHSGIAGHFAHGYVEFPTYHPSSMRKTATEVTVTSGGEASGIDIRYREDRGRIK